MSFPGCGCGNYWNGSVKTVCGEFETPQIPDQGRCASRHVKLGDEAPTLPVARCNDDQYTVVYQPENVQYPFIVLARMFNECCEAFTDENGDEILLVVDGLSDASAGTC